MVRPSYYGKGARTPPSRNRFVNVPSANPLVSGGAGTASSAWRNDARRISSGRPAGQPRFA